MRAHARGRVGGGPRALGLIESGGRPHGGPAGRSAPSRSPRSRPRSEQRRRASTSAARPTRRAPRASPPPGRLYSRHHMMPLRPQNGGRNRCGDRPPWVACGDGVADRIAWSDVRRAATGAFTLRRPQARPPSRRPHARSRRGGAREGRPRARWAGALPLHRWRRSPRARPRGEQRRRGAHEHRAPDEARVGGGGTRARARNNTA